MPEPEPVRPSIRSQGRVMSSSRLESRLNTHDEYPRSESPQRPTNSRSPTFQGPISIQREGTPVLNRMNNLEVGTMRSQLRPSSRTNTGADIFGDRSDDSTLNSGSPDRSYGARSVSPATSHGSGASRSAILSLTNGRKNPPPPPPSRAKKPPPPPPMKRADMSSASVNRY
jgi:hypothetical protein